MPEALTKVKGGRSNRMSLTLADDDTDTLTDESTRRPSTVSANTDPVRWFAI